MAIINQGFVDGAHAVARAVELHARQTIATSISSALSSPTPLPTSTSILSSASPTDIAPAPTTSANNNNNNNNNNSGTSSPLLFFVALGFGVVFTNLWIIVGVKYCFRYNARNRALRGGLDENGEPINLENMPARPHRRRREKKLMSMDEVNEKFPMMKYKSWVADRAKDGLPTAGGVSVAPSRANSVRSVQGIVPELPSKERHSTADERPDTSAAAKPVAKPESETTENSTGASGTASAETGAALTQTQTAASIVTKDPDRTPGSDDEEEDDHINAAIPPELLTTSGDTCAICIDTLEDDDDVRGLTCGHAFHAVCLDPWLTNRRACCPLCKADYYTPKPRPAPAAEGSDPLSPTATNAADPARNNGRLNLPLAPPRTFAGWSFRSAPRVPVAGRTNGAAEAPSGQEAAQRQPRIWERRRRETTEAAAPATQEHSDQQGSFARFRSRFPPFRADHVLETSRNGAQAQPREDVTASGANNTTTTPSQLEAGTGTSGRFN